jgi:hypothetical protein
MRERGEAAYKFTADYKLSWFSCLSWLLTYNSFILSSPLSHDPLTAFTILALKIRRSMLVPPAIDAWVGGKPTMPACLAVLNWFHIGLPTWYLVFYHNHASVQVSSAHCVRSFRSEESLDFYWCHRFDNVFAVHFVLLTVTPVRESCRTLRLFKIHISSLFNLFQFLLQYPYTLAFVYQTQ